MTSIVSVVGGAAVGAYLSGTTGLFLGGAVGAAVAVAIEGLVTELFRHKGA
jgi:hypothetical protein